VEIENEFTVKAPVDQLWAYLLDVERIAPCMPGAELTETLDERSWKGKVNMKLGPVSLSFAGTVAIEERDDEAHRVVLHAKGMEAKGKGAANAVVTSWLEPGSEDTTVKLRAEIHLTGSVAQLSRGLLPEVSKRLTQQFADCLQESMQAEQAAVATPAQPAAEGEAAPAESPARPPVKAEPISGIRLGLVAIWAAIVTFFKRLFGRRDRT
jgi:carbon monoxide dehydrogenase subunit G